MCSFGDGKATANEMPRLSCVFAEMNAGLASERKLSRFGLSESRRDLHEICISLECSMCGKVMIGVCVAVIVENY